MACCIQSSSKAAERRSSNSWGSFIPKQHSAIYNYMYLKIQAHTYLTAGGQDTYLANEIGI